MKSVLNGRLVVRSWNQEACTIYYRFELSWVAAVGPLQSQTFLLYHTDLEWALEHLLRQNTAQRESICLVCEVLSCNPM